MVYKHINPYALYMHCDASMAYDSKTTGGVGIEIIFPDFFEMQSVKISIGKYEGANIERLELEAIKQGLLRLIRLFDQQTEKFRELRMIIIVTDREGLADNNRTNPYRIKEWRKNKWRNHEDKAIKNADLLDRIDKIRQKIITKYHYRIEIEYQPRRFNKGADKLSKIGRKKTEIKSGLAISGIKIGKRKFDGGEISYNILKARQEYLIHPFLKQAVQDQWESKVEICVGQYKGLFFKIYSDKVLADKIKRRNLFIIRIKKVFSYHVAVYRKITSGQAHKSQF